MKEDILFCLTKLFSEKKVEDNFVQHREMHIIISKTATK
jgi:hypothetical protein